MSGSALEPVEFWPCGFSVCATANPGVTANKTSIDTLANTHGTCGFLGGVLIESYTGNDPLSAQFLPHTASTEKTRLFRGFDSEGTFASSKARPFKWLGRRWSTRVFALWRGAA